MRLLMLGAPGSGKGTQAKRIAEHYGVTHLASGDLLRREVAAQTELGRQVESILASGDLVPDEIIEDLVYGPLLESSANGGYILDGFPRTLHQAERAYEIAREANATAHAVIHLDVPADELVRRALARGQGRADDNETTIRHRIEVYDNQTQPLVDYYSGRGLLMTVDGRQSPDEVFDEIIRRLDALPT